MAVAERTGSLVGGIFGTAALAPFLANVSPGLEKAQSR